MNNPFEVIEARLSNIENLILDLKHKSKQAESSNQPERLLTIQEAAELLSLTVPTLYSKVSKGELPVMKRSNRLYFFRTELLDYLKGGRKKSIADVEQEAIDYLNKKGGIK
ncbi:helix-turn-helix domain-containing protein [Cyclobacterium marinum]|uniref:helix-turn-helix domain-containing protein n=1 Tax=Cyclobacterium marinum TaxID=104 RepID=UPI0011ECE281|nr:helix-turn-helix domain-containing protein [Cyclobacterium marinum]MBI0401362.1 helix-turn-helix domain-containing protein [Cyclobacterium marinum]